MPTAPLGQLTEPTIELVESWMRQARATETKADQELMDQLVGLITDPDGVSFTMRFVDRVIRPESNRVAAHQLQALVSDHELPGFVSGLDSLLLRAGARLAPLAQPLPSQFYLICKIQNWIWRNTILPLEPFFVLGFLMNQEYPKKQFMH